MDINSLLKAIRNLLVRHGRSPSGLVLSREQHKIMLLSPKKRSNYAAIVISGGSIILRIIDVWGDVPVPLSRKTVTFQLADPDFIDKLDVQLTEWGLW